MSQKDLNYIEDIYKHSTLLIDNLECIIETIDDDSYIKLFESQLSSMEKITSKLEDLLEDSYE